MSTELRVFISSTFRDLQEEREHLVKKIFPEIRALCRERGVTFTDVDLRWGLTEEEAVLGRVIRTCLEEIDKCRPYFIGMIGNRYGWAPELHEILMDPDLLAKYPWIEDVAIEGASVTEMEFIHGVFDAPQVDGEYAFFYHRPGDPSEADDPVRLQSLLERIHASGRPLREFDDVDALGEVVREDLLRMIDSHWPRSEAPTALELERRAHAAFASSRIRAYIPNPLYLKEFTRWAADVGKPLVVSGESGLGKSSLVAYMVEYYRRQNPTALVIEHYVGASRSSGSAVAAMRHVIDAIQERFGLEEPLPAKEEELEGSFQNWLFRCEQLAAQEGIRVLIVLDAVNQLNESGRRLGWLPKTIPQGIRLVISTTPGETDDQLRERGWERLVVTPLVDERVRQSIVVRYLGEFHKGIRPEQVRRVISDPKASSPLFLRVVAEELRLHGEHETLDEAIDRYVGAEDLLDVFDVVLERIEGDYGAEAVRDLLSAIGAARAGLSETELLEITGINRLELSRLLFAFDYHLIHRDGLVGFFHGFLQQAVEKRYLNQSERAAQMRRLAAYFQTAPESRRPAGELLWLYRQLDDVEALRALLVRFPLLRILTGSGELYEVLGAWKELVERGIDPVETYRKGLAEVCRADSSPEELADAYAVAAQILGDLGAWNAVREIAEEGLHHAEASGYLKGQATAESTIGNICMDQGKFDEALLRLRHARQLHEQAGDHDAASAVVGELGIVYTYRDGIGDMARAMECYRERLAVIEQNGNRRKLAALLHNIGVVYMREGRIEEALDHFDRGVEINASLGNLQWLMANLNSIGEANTKQGYYGRALDVHERVLTIAEKLGDRNKVTTSLAQIGLVSLESGDYDRALEYVGRAHSMFVEMGDQRKAMVTLGLIGDILKRQGNYDGALDHLGEALGNFREMGAHANVAITLQILADTLLNSVTHESDSHSDMPRYISTHITGTDRENWQAMTLRRAREYAEEVIEIAGQLQYAESLFESRVLLERIKHELRMRPDQSGTGNANTASMTDASAALREMLEAAVDDAQKAELHFWLWELDADTTSRAEAVRLYAALLEKTPTFAFRQRFEKLTAAANPPWNQDATE